MPPAPPPGPLGAPTAAGSLTAGSVASAKHREEGNRLYRSRDFDGAIRSYDLAYETSGSDADRVKALNNRALCNFKLCRYDHCQRDSESVLMIDPRNSKARLRHGRAAMQLGYLSVARSDLAVASSSLEARRMLEPLGNHAAEDRELRDALRRLGKLERVAAPSGPEEATPAHPQPVHG